MIEYILQNRTFVFSYKELKESYLNVCQMTDAEFIDNLPTAIHLACAICFFKEIPTYVCLSDVGIIHELSHLLHIKNEPSIDISDIRAKFKDTLLLA